MVQTFLKHSKLIAHPFALVGAVYEWYFVAQVGKGHQLFVFCVYVVVKNVFVWRRCKGIEEAHAYQYRPVNA